MFLSYIDPGTGFTITTGGGLIVAFIASFLAPFLFFFKKILKFFKGHRRFTNILLIIIIIAVTIFVGVTMNKKRSDFDKRIIILGMDGLSPDIIEQMMSEGKLPHFTQLKEKGSYKRLTTTNPSQSPVAWSGFATGKNPGKHGLFDFIKRDQNNYMLEIKKGDF